MFPGGGGSDKHPLEWKLQVGRGVQSKNAQGGRVWIFSGARNWKKYVKTQFPFITALVVFSLLYIDHLKAFYNRGGGSSVGEVTRLGGVIGGVTRRGGLPRLPDRVTFLTSVVRC